MEKISVRSLFKETATYTGKEVTVAGRIMSKRGQGKVVFSDIHDRDGKIQLFIKIDEVGEEALKQYKTNDLGDWVACTGEVFKTKTGEVSVKAKEIELVYESIKNANPDDKLVQLKSLEALEKVADGDANKVFIPFEATGALSSLGAIKEVLKDDKKNK